MPNKRTQYFWQRIHIIIKYRRVRSSLPTTERVHQCNRIQCKVNRWTLWMSRVVTQPLYHIMSLSILNSVSAKRSATKVCEPRSSQHAVVVTKIENLYTVQSLLRTTSLRERRVSMMGDHDGSSFPSLLNPFELARSLQFANSVPESVRKYHFQY